MPRARTLAALAAIAATAATFAACGSSPPAEPKAPEAASSAKADDKPAAKPDDKPAGKKELKASDCPAAGTPVKDPPPPSAGKQRHEDIHAIIKEHRDKLRCCYDAARQHDASLKGNFTFELVIKTDGTIKSAMHKKPESDIKDDGMGDCAFTVLRTLKFPAASDGKETTATFPMGFTPGGGK